jgi:protein-S-isoprenylcysteine O-methyltransferase Ste14
MLVLVVIVVPFLPLLLSGNWRWWEAWVYAVIFILGFIVSRLLAARRHPDILVERAQFATHSNTQPWDKVLAPLTGIGSGVIPLVAGLEARWGSPPDFGLPIKLAALAVLLLGFLIASSALIENRFFSGVVRIQADRGHHVVSTGPYRWVRHPGYAGSLLAFLATPFLLDSPWALIPAAFVTAVLFYRTHLEDETLRKLLDGYRDYAARVRWRLVPGVW